MGMEKDTEAVTVKRVRFYMVKMVHVWRTLQMRQNPNPAQGGTAVTDCSTARAARR